MERVLRDVTRPDDDTRLKQERIVQQNGSTSGATDTESCQ